MVRIYVSGLPCHVQATIPDARRTRVESSQHVVTLSYHSLRGPPLVLLRLASACLG